MELTCEWLKRGSTHSLPCLMWVLWPQGMSWRSCSNIQSACSESIKPGIKWILGTKKKNGRNIHFYICFGKIFSFPAFPEELKMVVMNHIKSQSPVSCFWPVPKGDVKERIEGLLLSLTLTKCMKFLFKTYKNIWQPTTYHEFQNQPHAVKKMAPFCLLLTPYLINQIDLTMVIPSMLSK